MGCFYDVLCEVDTDRGSTKKGWKIEKIMNTILMGDIFILRFQNSSSFNYTCNYKYKTKHTVMIDWQGEYI